MDPVSAAASIVGILGFAGTALNAIRNLKHFCHEFSQDATQDFLHDLEVTAKLLTDVQVLFERLKWANQTVHTEYRAEALSIQVDDCSRDLTKWLRIALRMKKERAGGKQSIKMQFFNSFLTAISKLSRTSARKRLHWHQENINTTLSLFGRHISLANSVTLHSVDETVGRISQDLSDNAEELSKRVSSLSSSASSLQVQNNSMSDKLDIVTDLLQQVISSNQSQTSSIKSSNHSGPDKSIKSTTVKSKKDNVDVYTSDGQAADFILSSPTYQDTNATAESDENMVHPAEFDALFRATKSLVNSLHQIHHPLVAEFLSTMHAFDTLTLQHRCLQMGSLANTWISAHDLEAGLHKVTQMKKAAAFQLVSLRKQCGFEGFGDTLELVMSNAGVSERDLERWESLTTLDHTSQKRLRLGELRNPDPDEQRKERLTRTNEWMLGVFYALPYFIEVYRMILTLEETKQRELSRSLGKYQQEGKGETTGEALPRTILESTDEALRRTIVKFWFLDSAAMSEEEYADSQYVGSDSEATFRRPDEEDEEDEPLKDTIGQAKEVELNIPMSKETAPMFNLLYDQTAEVDLANTAITLHGLAPDGSSRKLLAAASKAVTDYCQEPSRACNH